MRWFPLIRQFQDCKGEIKYARITAGCRYLQWQEVRVTCSSLRKAVSSLSREQRAKLRGLLITAKKHGMLRGLPKRS
jgi:hypothetical protein